MKRIPFSTSFIYKYAFIVVILLSCIPILQAQEICNNGIDDDADGLIDCFDDDCCLEPSCINFWYSCTISECPDGGDNITLNSTQLGNPTNISTISNLVTGDINNDGVNEVVAMGADNRIYIINTENGDLMNVIDPSLSNSFGPPFIGIGEVISSSVGAEIIIVSGRNVHCYSPAGVNLWNYTSADFDLSFGTNISFADFDHDGFSEVYTKNAIFNGQTGAQIIALPELTTPGNVEVSFATNVYQDMFCADCAGLEFIRNSQIFSVNIATGTFNLIEEYQPTLGVSEFSIPVDWNGDGLIDIVSLGGNRLDVWDPLTGNTIDNVAINDFTNGMPNIGDIDGDGEVELLYIEQDINRGKLIAYDNDLSILWTKSVWDGSAFTGLTLFDFDKNGSQEVVYRDENDLRIIDGSDGLDLHTANCQSGTGSENPIVADVDNDNEANILMVCGTEFLAATGSIIKFSSNIGFEWADARPVWNQFNYFNVHVNDDLTIPRYQQEHHLLETTNTYLNQYSPSENVLFEFEMQMAQYQAGDCQNIEVYICNYGSQDWNDELELSIYNSETDAYVETISMDIDLEVGVCGFFDVIVAFDENINFFTAIINDSGQVPPASTFNLPNTNILECDYTNNMMVFLPVLQSIELDIELDSIKMGCNETIICGPDGDFEYQWSNNSDDRVLTVTAAGDYTLTVTDACGNTDEETVSVTVDNCQIACTTTELQVSTCDGSVSLTASVFLVGNYSDEFIETLELVITDQNTGLAITQGIGTVTFTITQNTLFIYTITNPATGDSCWGTMNVEFIDIEGCGPPCSTEICDNGIDDDGDGLIDCLDDDCSIGGEGNLITNGDFLAGDTGFTTSYNYSPPNDGNHMFGDYTLGLTSWELLNNGNWHQTPAVDGTAMFIDGQPAFDEIFCQTITVKPNQQYYFSALVTDLILITSNFNPPEVLFTVNGLDLTDLYLDGAPTSSPIIPPKDEQWHLVTGIWNSGSQTSADICFRSVSPEVSGNDFGVDQLIFATCASEDPPDSPMLQCELQLLNNTDCLATSGTISSTITGGQDPYTLEWDDGSTDTEFQFTSAGTYGVTVTDAANCTSYCELTVGSGLDLELENTEIVFPDCNTLYLNICNLSTIDFNDVIEISIYDAIPEFAQAQLEGTFSQPIAISAGECELIPIDISFADLDIYWMIINDNGSLSLPINISDDFPSTSILECDYENNLGFYIPQDLPETNVDETLCPGETYALPDGEIVTMGGIYMDTLISSFGCDSIVVTTLDLLDNCGEDCSNGIDDDGDGLIDVFDPDCMCTESEENLIPNGDVENRNGCCSDLAFNFCITDWIIINGSADFYHPACANNSYNPDIPITSGALGFGVLFPSNPGSPNQGSAETMAVCLNSPIQANKTYRFTLDIASALLFGTEKPEHELIFYGIPSCADVLTYGDDQSCDALPVQEELIRIQYSALNVGWNDLSFEFTTTTSHEALYWFPECLPVDGEADLYYTLVDNLVITEIVSDSIEIIGSVCDGDVTLEVESTTGATYIWYSDSIQIATGNSFPQFDPIAYANNAIHVYIEYEDGTCLLLGPVEFPEDQIDIAIDIAICSGETFTTPAGIILDQPGSYPYTLDGTYCDTVTTYNLSFHPELILNYQILDGCENSGIIISDDPLIAEIFVDNQSYGLTLDILNLDVGMHNLEIMDINGCLVSDVFELTGVESDIAITSDEVDFNCIGTSLTICLDQVDSSTSLIDLDVYGVEASSGNLTIITSNDLTNIDFTQPCFGITVVVPNLDYSSYSQILIVVNNVSNLMNLSELDVFSNDIGECDFTNNYFLLDLQPISSFTLGPDVDFCGDNYLIEGPVGYSSYLWSDGSTDQNLLVLATGTYSLTVTDNCGREIDDSINVSLGSLDNYTVTANGTCSGLNNGSIILDFDDFDNEELTYQWENSIGTLNAAFNLSANSYMVTVTYEMCEEIIEIMIEENAPINSFLNYSDILCNGASNGTLEIIADDVETIILNNQEFDYPMNFDNLSAGEYTLVLVDLNGCSQESQIQIDELDPIDLLLPDTIYTSISESLEIDLMGIIPEGAQISWSPSELLSCDDCVSPTFIGDQNANIEVTITIDGCALMLSTYIVFDDDLEIYIPNIFHPNSNSGNHEFGALGPFDFDFYSTFIYDRWGNLIFESLKSEEQEFWDGSFKGKDAIAGVYVYYMEFELANGKTINRRGTITLVW